MSRIAIVTSLLLAFASCSRFQENPIVVDFVMKDYKFESTPGCPADSTCASFEVTVPVFNNLDSTVSKSLNEKVNYILNGSTGEPRDLELIGADFIRDFRQVSKDIPGYDMGWYFKGKVHVLILSDTLISLQVDTESFTGGAHASFTTNFVNIEPKTGTAFLLDAMLRPGYQDELNRLGEEDLRQQLLTGVGDSTEVELPEGSFQLNENYGFRKEGVVFYFNDYDLGAFAEGPVEVLIPYEKLETLRK